MFHAFNIMSLALVAASPVSVTPAEPAATVQIEEPVQSGFQVVVDPATGEIIDNPEPFELDRVSEGIDRRRRSSWDLETFFLQSGGRGVFLDGWADHSLTVEVGPDGEMTVGCSQGATHEDYGHEDLLDTRATDGGEDVR